MKQRYILPFLMVIMGVFSGSGAVAQETVVPQTVEDVKLSFAPAVKKVAPAVVNIYTRKIVVSRQSSPLMDDPFFRQFFGGSFPLGVPREQIQNALGSGVIVRSDGIVVTNNHVVEGADSITVALQDRREFEADVIGRDERTDLAVLRLKGTGLQLPTAYMAETDDLEVGDLVLAIGNPFGVGQTVTSGIVSALARTTVGVADFRSFIQTDAAINPGNSGGALVDLKGNLVGINTAIYTRDRGNMGIGFAIPVELVHTVLNSILEKGKAVRPWLGVTGQPVEQDIAASLGLDRPEGVLINMVAKGGPAALAGMKTGDVVVAVNGKAVVDAEALNYRIAVLPVGGSAILTVLRDGRMMEISVSLQPPPEVPARDESRISGQTPLAGALLANLNPAMAEERGLPFTPDTVVITGLENQSRAAWVGLREGDILRELNGKKVKTVQEAKSLLRDNVPRWKITVERQGQLMNFLVN